MPKYINYNFAPITFLLKMITYLFLQTFFSFQQTKTIDNFITDTLHLKVLKFSL